jgi:hypothetical protein
MRTVISYGLVANVSSILPNVKSFIFLLVKLYKPLTVDRERGQPSDDQDGMSARGKHASLKEFSDDEQSNSLKLVETKEDSPQQVNDSHIEQEHNLCFLPRPFFSIVSPQGYIKFTWF